MRLALGFIMICALCGCENSIEEASSTRLDDLRGQWVLVNYWAQWCKPCIEEIPELNHFGKSRADVTVLGVNYEGATGEILATQVEALGIDFPNIIDPSAELGIPRPVVLPTTLLVDPTGAIAKLLIGPQTKDSLDAAIAAAQGSSTH